MALVVGYIVITSVIMAVAGLQLFVSATDRCPCFTGFYCYAPGDCSGSTGFIGGTSRDTVLRGERGSLRINLQWGSTDDLDLLVINPCSDTIYYKRKRQVCGGCTGTLDVDANAKPEMAIANPQENIFFDELPREKFKWGVQMYNKRVSNTCPFRITIQAHNFEQVIDTVLVFDRLGGKYDYFYQEI